MKTRHQLLMTTVCAIAIFLLVGLPAYLIQGTDAVPVMGITVGSCWLGAVLAILSTNIFRHTLKKEFPWFIIGGIFRMGVPFTVALIVMIAAEKGFGFLVLTLFPIVYLLMLPVDAMLALPGREKKGMSNS